MFLYFKHLQVRDFNSKKQVEINSSPSQKVQKKSIGLFQSICKKLKGGNFVVYNIRVQNTLSYMTQFIQSLFCSSTFHCFQREQFFVQNILHEQMQNNIFFLLFANFVCILHYLVAAIQGQLARMKLAQCLQKCFCLCMITLSLCDKIKSSKAKLKNSHD